MYERYIIEEIRLCFHFERNIAIISLKAISIFILKWRDNIGKGSMLHKNLVFINCVFVIIKQHWKFDGLKSIIRNLNRQIYYDYDIYCDIYYDIRVKHIVNQTRKFIKTIYYNIKYLTYLLVIIGDY